MREMSLIEAYTYQLHIIMHDIESSFQRTLKLQTDLSYTQFIFLVALRQHQPANQRTIARYLKQSPAAVNRQTEVGWDKGWIAIGGAKDDRRGQVLTLSEKGKKTLENGLHALETSVLSTFKDSESRASLLDHMKLLTNSAKNTD